MLEVEVECEWWVEERWMSELEERRREKRPGLRVGDVTGAGGGEGSRRPKRGIVVFGWGCLGGETGEGQGFRIGKWVEQGWNWKCSLEKWIGLEV